MARRRSLFQSVRSRIIVGGSIWILLMTVLGTYATTLTFAEGLRLSDVRAFHEKVYAPTERLVTELQRERLLTVEFLGGGGGAVRDRLEEQRSETDKAAAAFRRITDTAEVQDASALRSRIDATVADLGDLGRQRVAIINDDLDRTKATVLFNRTVDAAFQIYRELPSANEPHVGDHHQSLVDLQRAREILAREVAQLAGALAAGGLTAGEQQAFERAVGSQRLLLAEFANGLDESERKQWTKLVRTSSFTTFRDLENEVTRSDDTATGLPVSATAWKHAGEGVAAEVRTFESGLVDDMLAISDSESSSLLLRGTLIIVFGALFVIVMITVWLMVAPRYVTKQLTGLKESALELADHRLPEVMEQLRRGEKVDLHTAAPPLEFGQDEFGQVGRAFNKAQQVAVRAAIEQTELRSGIRDVFVNLARRSQGLVHRQLALLDEMERRTSDPDELERLFAIDHLATRMRRHAEDLIILSGSAPGRQWRKAVPMVDVVRSAVGEIESYARVTVLPIADAKLSGRVVADVIHLLAELVENAAAYSPPQTKVRVGGDLVPNGFVVEIEDSGLGMSREDLTRYNERLVNPPEFNPSDSVQLGLFVVARLAQRHGIRVHLRDSPYGGTTAIVLVPGSLVESGDAKPAIEAGPSRAERPSPGPARPGSPTVAPPAAPPPAAAAPRNTLDPLGTLDTSALGTMSLDTTALDTPPLGTPVPEEAPLEARQVSPGGAFATSADVEAAFRSPNGGPVPSVLEPMPTVPEPAPDSAGPAPAGDDTARFESRHGSLPAESERPFDPNAAPATATGLPRRVRQASLASELRETTAPPPPEEQPADNPLAGRSPEQIRQMMTTFQRGSLRGRSEAPAADHGRQATSRPSPRPSTTSQDEDK